MMRKSLLMLLLLPALAACGLKGPLYLPEDKPAATSAAKSNPPAEDKKSPGAK